MQNSGAAENPNWAESEEGEGCVFYFTLRPWEIGEQG
jgi:hypothetical protein